MSRRALVPLQRRARHASARVACCQSGVARRRALHKCAANGVVLGDVTRDERLDRDASVWSNLQGALRRSDDDVRGARCAGRADRRSCLGDASGVRCRRRSCRRRSVERRKWRSKDNWRTIHHNLHVEVCVIQILCQYDG